MWNEAFWTFFQLFHSLGRGSALTLASKFFPFAILLEFPLYLLVLLGIVRYGLRRKRPLQQREAYPRVSCIITCYSEGDDVRKTINSLAEQDYPGFIEILPIIDGAIQNANTLRAALDCQPLVGAILRRRLMVIPKWQRGGRVSSLNTGLMMATGEVIMALDGDTSFDNDMVRRATAHFDDPDVVGVAGCLRVRNAARTLSTRFQALEYLLSIGAGKTGLSEFNIVNNISGAFGIFRASFLRILGGWDAGTAEDLDLTLRMKQFFGRNTRLRIVFDPRVIGHTDAPDTFRVFFKQRWRWDGDLFYLYIRKYRKNLRPSLLGWRNFLFTIYSGLIQQLLLPFIIVAYTVFLFISYPAAPIIGLLLFVYWVYLLALIMLYALYLVAISERPRQDLFYVLILPFYPLFAFAARVNSVIAMLQEIIIKTHLDSSMAPWWVLKKTKF